jgi:hypothetical protein
MDIRVTAGGKVRTQHAFQEGEGADEPGYLCEIGELPTGERCRRDRGMSSQ